MKIRYILGNFGSGKFTTCVKEILEKQKLYPDKTLIFIVPEQFSAYAQRKLIEGIENNVLLNIRVLSFKSLSYYVFSEVGLTKRGILEDYGQIMLLRKVIYNIKDKLIYFNNISHNNIGTIEKISSIINDFFKYNVSKEKLEEFLKTNNEGENLYFKIHDLKLIYEVYLNYINKNYITSHEILDILNENIDKSKFIDNSEVWIYGFNGFTPQELKVITKIFKKAEKTNIALHFDSNNINIQEISPFDNFFDIKVTIKKLNDIISKNNLILEEIEFLDKNRLHLGNKELLHLAKNYFYHNAKPYEDKVFNIEVFSCENKYLEVENVAKNIIKLVRDFDYKFKEIAIVLADLSYNKTIDFIFNKYSIPYFLDFKKSINTRPLTILIFSILDVIIYNWDYNSIFQYLKTDFILGYGDEDFKLEKNHINLLENYVLANGIKGYKWKLETWEYGFLQNKDFDKELINKIKKYVCKSLEVLNFNNKDKYSITDISTKIIDFLIDLNIFQTLEEKSNKDKSFLDYNNYSNTSKHEEHFQVCNSIMATIEKLVDILGDQEVTIDEYSKILKAGIEKNEIALHPQTQDQVIIGDFRRTRFPKVRAIFILSVNQGVVPSFVEDNELISDIEKVSLFAKGIEVSPKTTQLLVQENLNIYSTITKPTEKLFLSYLSSDLDGQSKKPSFVINRVLSLFPKIKLQYVRSLEKDINEIYSPEVTFEKVLENIPFIDFNEDNEENRFFKDILSWYLLDEKYKEKIDFIRKGLMTLKPNEYLEDGIISKVYNNNTIFSSVSKLEKFNSCPFSYFLEYNLNVKERKIYEVNSLDFGIFYHSIIENFSKLVFTEKFDYKTLSFKEVRELVGEAITKYINSLDTDIFSSSKRYKYFLENIKRISEQSSNAIINQLKNGSFVPYGFEVEFKSSSTEYDNKNIFTPIKIILGNNYKMFLNGKIDRVDILYNNDNLYIKILDYKSSDKNIDFNNVYHGLQLQLILYLDAFIKFNKNYLPNKNILPAGLFYFKFREAILNFEKTNLEKKAEGLFNIKGVYSNDSVVKKGIDLEYKEDSKSLKGISSSSILSQEQFSKLRNFVGILAKEIGKEITSGNIKINPYKNKSGTACEYCIYKSICNIEVLSVLEEGKYKNLTNIEGSEIWQLIDKKLEEGEG